MSDRTTQTKRTNIHRKFYKLLIFRRFTTGGIRVTNKLLSDLIGIEYDGIIQERHYHEYAIECLVEESFYVAYKKASTSFSKTYAATKYFQQMYGNVFYTNLDNISSMINVVAKFDDKCTLIKLSHHLGSYFDLGLYVLEDL